MSIGKNIRKLRKEKKITMKKLGEKIGISEQGVGNYERDERKPNIEILNKIADVLNVPITQLIDSETEPIKLSSTDLYIKSRTKYINAGNIDVSQRQKNVIKNENGPLLTYKFSNETIEHEKEVEELCQKYFYTLVEHETNKVDNENDFFKLVLSWSPWDDLDNLSEDEITEIINAVTLMYKFKLYEIQSRN